MGSRKGRPPRDWFRALDTYHAVRADRHNDIRWESAIERAAHSASTAFAYGARSKRFPDGSRSKRTVWRDYSAGKELVEAFFAEARGQGFRGEGFKLISHWTETGEGRFRLDSIKVEWAE